MAMHNYTQGTRSLGSKMAVHIELVNPSGHDIQGRLKDGGIAHISTVGVSNTFIWPQVGEYWFIRKDNGNWKLDSKIDVKNDYPINEMQPGEARIGSDTIKDASGKSVLATFDSSADSYSVLQHQNSNTITLVKLNDAGTILTFTTKDVNHLIAGQQVTISGFKPDSYNGKFTVLGSGASAKLAVAIPAITVSVAAVNADASTVTFSSNSLLQSSTNYKIYCNNIFGNVTFTTPSTLGSTVTFNLTKGSGSIVTTTTTVDSKAVIVPVFNTITLDSVENWPSSGTVTIDGEIFSYSGLKVAPDNQLTGISKANENKTIIAAHAVGATVQAPNTSDKPTDNTFKITSSNTDAVETYGQIENQWVPSSDMKVNSVTVPDNGSINIGAASKLEFDKAGYIKFDDGPNQFIAINGPDVSYNNGIYIKGTYATIYLDDVDPIKSVKITSNGDIRSNGGTIKTGSNSTTDQVILDSDGTITATSHIYSNGNITMPKSDSNYRIQLRSTSGEISVKQAGDTSSRVAIDAASLLTGSSTLNKGEITINDGAGGTKIRLNEGLVSITPEIQAYGGIDTHGGAIYTRGRGIDLRDYNTANPPVALQTGGNLYLGTDANNGGQISAAKIGINGAVDAGQVATFNGKIGASAISTGGLTTSDTLAVNQASVDSGQVATFNGEIGVKGLATGGNITGGSIDGTTLKQSGTPIFANDVDIFKSYVASQNISSSRTGTSSGAKVGKVVRLGPNFKYFAHSETVLTNDLANNGLATVGKFDPQTNAGGLNWFVNFYGKGSSAQDETNQILTGVYGGGGFLYIWVKNVSGAVRSVDGIVILWTVDFV